MQTILFDLSLSHPFYLINLKAVSRTHPADPPTSNPYLRIRSLAYLRDETSSVFTQ